MYVFLAVEQCVFVVVERIAARNSNGTECELHGAIPAEKQCGEQYSARDVCGSARAAEFRSRACDDKDQKKMCGSAKRINWHFQNAVTQNAAITLLTEPWKARRSPQHWMQR